MTLGIEKCPNYAQPKTWPIQLLDLSVESQFLCAADSQHSSAALVGGSVLATTRTEWKTEAET